MAAMILLMRMPGTIAIKQRLSACYIRPQYAWAVPLVGLPPIEHHHMMLKSILNTKTTWWCKHRTWMQQVHLSPIYGTVILAFKSVHLFAEKSSDHLENALTKYAEAIGLEFVCLSRGSGAQNGALLRALDDDARQVHDAIEKCEGSRTSFTTNSEAGQHAIRVICRTRELLALGKAPRTKRRNDIEGFEQVDVEAYSQQSFTKWLRRLNDDHKRLVFIWLGGAVKTPTRYHSPGATPECPFCGFSFASSRHWWQDCVRFATKREYLQSLYGLNADYWSTQPRVTFKSGWPVYNSASSSARRGTLMSVNLQLAISIMETYNCGDL
jgi:hypothetical protein